MSAFVFPHTAQTTVSLTLFKPEGSDRAPVPTLAPGQTLADRPLASEDLLKAIVDNYTVTDPNTDAVREIYFVYVAALVSGSGKSTFFYNCVPKLVEHAERNRACSSDATFMKALRNASVLYMEFNGRGDQFTEDDRGLSLDVALKARLIARALCGQSYAVARANKRIAQAAAKFSEQQILTEYVRRERARLQLADSEPFIVLVHVDEYQLIKEQAEGKAILFSKETLKEFLYSFCTFSRDRTRSLGHKNIVQPVITATYRFIDTRSSDPTLGRKFRAISFRPLSLQQSLELLKPIVHPSWLSNSDFVRLVGDCGGVALYLTKLGDMPAFHSKAEEVAPNFFSSKYAVLTHAAQERFRNADPIPPETLLEVFNFALCQFPIANNKVFGKTGGGEEITTNLLSSFGRAYFVDVSADRCIVSVPPVLLTGGQLPHAASLVRDSLHFHSSGSLLEVLTMATLSARIQCWKADSRAHFSLRELLGLDDGNIGNISSISNIREDTIKKVLAANISIDHFDGIPVGAVDEFSSSAKVSRAVERHAEALSSGTHSADPLTALEVSLAGSDSKRRVNIHTHPNHLIIHHGGSNDSSDIMLVLQRPNKKKLMVLFQCKYAGTNTRVPLEGVRAAFAKQRALYTKHSDEYDFLQVLVASYAVENFEDLCQKVQPDSQSPSVFVIANTKLKGKMVDRSAVTAMIPTFYQRVLQ